MTVDFGLALVERHTPSHLTKWMDDLDVLLPKLEGKFKSLWMTDHLFWEDDYVYEAWTVLSYLAATWKNFDVGPMVLGQNYRNPALLAKMGATLQVFSHGRFIMGVGAGWKEDEYKGYNYPMPPVADRMEQLDETLEIIKWLWTQPGKVTFQGKHYSVTDAYLEPKPNPVPKIVIGGGGKKTMRIAARHADWWNLSDAGLSRYMERATILKQHCEDLGRDPNSIRLTWFGRVVLGKNDAEVNARANSRVIKYNTDNAFVGTPAQVVEQMQAFVANRVDYYMIDILDFETPEIQNLFLEEVLPKVKDL